MRALFKSFGVLLGLLAMFAFGFAWRDLQKLEAPSSGAFLSLLGAETRHPGSVSSVQIFRTSYHRILERYGRKVDPVDLKYAGMEGMMASLGDPHTLFLPPQDSENFSIETTGKFVGVGARLTPDPLGARVAVVFEGGPADRAGLRGTYRAEDGSLVLGDIVQGIDGREVESIDDLYAALERHKAGDAVKVRVLREGRTSEVEVRLEPPSE